MNENLYTISVDWFQVSCTRDPRQPLSEGMYLYGTATTADGRELCYKLTQPREFNAIFGNCLSVTLHGFRLATIYLEPRPTTIPKGLCLIKMSNPVLYSSRWMWYLCDILAALKWQFKAISRIDLACDFNEFANNLDPREFIRTYLKSGPWSPDSVSYWRVHGNKYAIIGEKKLKDKCVSGSSEVCLEHEVEYLRFGQRKSGVATYLYNKTRELNTKGGKDYIRDIWRDAGLTDSEENPVFRLEISVSYAGTSVKTRKNVDEINESNINKGLYKKNLDKWSVRSLSLDDFGTQQLVEGAFWSYASHYFSFRIVGPQQSPQHWIPLILFTPRYVTSIKPCRLSTPLDAGISERNAANKLEQLLYAANGLSLVELVSLDNTIALLRRLSGQKQTLVTEEQVQKAIDGLSRGWSWEELARRRVVSKTTMQYLRNFVDNAATRELQMYRRDSSVAEAMDVYDAQLSMIEEDAALCQ